MTIIEAYLADKYFEVGDKPLEQVLIEEGFVTGLSCFAGPGKARLREGVTIRYHLHKKYQGKAVNTVRDVLKLNKDYYDFAAQKQLLTGVSVGTLACFATLGAMELLDFSGPYPAETCILSFAAGGAMTGRKGFSYSKCYRAYVAALKQKPVIVLEES